MGRNAANGALLKHPLPPTSLPLLPKCFLETCLVPSGSMGPYVHKNSFTQAVISGVQATVSSSVQIRSSAVLPEQGVSDLLFCSAHNSQAPAVLCACLCHSPSHPQAAATGQPLLVLFPELSLACVLVQVPRLRTLSPLRFEGPACFLTKSCSPFIAQLTERMFAALPDRDLTT